MQKQKLRLIALLTALALLLGGCQLPLEELLDRAQQLLQTLTEPALQPANPLGPEDYTHYRDMVYTRPDPAAVQASFDALCQAAQGEDAGAVMEAVYAFYDAYDWYYTLYSLADIRYCGDRQDSYWEAEYSFCAENAPAMDALLEEMYYVLAKSPSRKQLEGRRYFGPGFFAPYDTENTWDSGFTALLEEEAALQSRYYTLYAQAQSAYEPGTEGFYRECADGLTQLLAELIATRQAMAAYLGYPSYDQFAWDVYYYRDYTPGQLASYLEEIRQTLVPLYQELAAAAWDTTYAPCTEAQLLRRLRQTAVNMGGSVEQAFYLLEAAQLYDLAYSPNKYNASFEVYLTGYDQPFIFLNPTRTAYDHLTLAHEFGHFCNDYQSWGSYGGIDVMEVFSQGMEYLSLCYAGDGPDLTAAKMADSLCVYVEQAAFAWFEQEAYRLTGEDLTAENLYRLFEEACTRYGFDWVEPRELVTISHYYTDPMYIVSYIVSNDAALQLYQLELAETGAGLARLEENLDSEEAYFLAFLDQLELQSPFAPGRLTAVKQTLQHSLPCAELANP